MSTDTTTAAGRTTFREVLGVREFRTLFLSRTLTVAATTLRMLAMSVLVLQLTGSPLLSGLAYGIGFAPQVVGGMTLISLADRLPPRATLVAGCLLEAAAAGTVYLLGGHVAASLVILGLVAMVAPVPGGAAAALIRRQLIGDRFVLGRSLLTVSGAVAQVVGLGVGGLVLALLGARGVLLAVVGVHLAAGLMAATLARTPAQADETDRPRLRDTVSQTLRVNRRLLGDRLLRGQLLVQSLPAALATGAEAVVASYALQQHLGGSSAGIMLAAVPAGMGLGNLLVGRLGLPATRERLVPWLLGVMGLPMLLFVLRPGLVAATALLFVMGSGMAYELGTQRRLLEVVPEAHAGQSFALLSALLMLSQGVAPILVGGIAGAATAAWAMVSVGVGMGLLVLALWRHLPPYADAAAAG